MHAKYLTVTESHKIARVPQLGQMMKIESDHVQKLQLVRSEVDQEICGLARVRAKSFIVTESREITRAPQLGQMRKM